MIDSLINQLHLAFANKVLFTIFIFIIGCCIGSFLNVIIYRLPLILHNRWRHEAQTVLGLNTDIDPKTLNLAYPRSHCPNCKVAVKPWHNIPLLGYLILRGKCFNCQKNISLIYPSIELFCGLYFILCLSTSVNFYLLISKLVFASFIICLTMIDYKHFILPDELTLPLMWLGIIRQFFGNNMQLKYAIIGAITGYLVLWLTYWLFKLIAKKEGMGYGDFKMLSAILAWLGPLALPFILLLAAGFGIIFALIMYYYKAINLKSSYLPFGTFMGIASLICIIYSGSISTLL